MFKLSIHSVFSTIFDCTSPSPLLPYYPITVVQITLLL